MAGLRTDGWSVAFTPPRSSRARPRPVHIGTAARSTPAVARFQSLISLMVPQSPRPFRRGTRPDWRARELPSVPPSPGRSWRSGTACRPRRDRPPPGPRPWSRGASRFDGTGRPPDSIPGPRGCGPPARRRLLSCLAPKMTFRLCPLRLPHHVLAFGLTSCQRTLSKPRPGARVGELVMQSRPIARSPVTHPILQDALNRPLFQR